MTTKTSIYLNKTSTEQVGQSLAQTLADTYLLYLKTQNFHWNVIDPRFHSLHELFEEQYTELAESVDLLAERLRMLKLRSPGSMHQFLELASLAESEGELSGNEMLKELCHDREAMIGQIRSRIEEAQNLGDEGTADLYIQQLRAHEKAAWMLRSHS